MRFILLQLLASLVLLSAAPIALAQPRVQLLRADIGFGNHYKVGSWTPLRIELLGGEKTINAMAEVRVPDGEGQITSISSMPFSLPAGGGKTVEMLVRVGQLDSSVQVVITNLDTRKKVAERKFTTSRELDDGGVAPGDPPTTRTIVEVSPNRLGTAAAQADKSNEAWYTQNVVGRVTDLRALPRTALAYEAVDTVVVATSDRDAWGAIRADDPRAAALVDWLQQGGRIVLCCGSNADVVLGPGGPLASLAPGKYSESVTVDNLTPLETYVGGNIPLPRRGRVRTTLPAFEDIHGDIEMSLGGRENRLPVVLRTRHGLGQVVFVGLDIDTPPVAKWKSRAQLMEKLLAFSNDDLESDTNNYYYDGPSDLSVALGTQFDHELERSGIRTPPFMAIAGLVVLYILLIGPGDYFLVKRVLKKMELTWVTFPAIVVLTCLAAYWYAGYLKGDSLRVNQVEIVDIDNTTGLSRGTMWTHIFSPSPDRYVLSLSAKSPAGDPVEIEQSSVAWLGKPTTGLGGMTNEAGMLSGFPAYGWSPDRQTLAGVPIEVWSTKTFVTRWQTQTNDKLSTDLTATTNELVVGSVTNSTSLDLTDCILVYSSWGWSLGDLEAGGTAEIKKSGLSTNSRSARKLRNLYRDRFNFNLSQGTYYEKQQLFNKLDLAGLAEMMMFYDALGGRRQSQQWLRYQQFVDLSHALDSETAMLVGRCQSPRSELLRQEDDQQQSMRGEQDRYEVLYRFVLPVKPPSE